MRAEGAESGYPVVKRSWTNSVFDAPLCIGFAAFAAFHYKFKLLGS